MIHTDTIAAPATPPGVGGIGIIRISGPESPAILQKLFHPAKSGALLSPRRMVLGTVRSPQTQAILDEVLAVYMPGPFSHTGEDVVEIHAHGGPAVVSAICDLVLGQGARLAEPGEFTRRAFLNGRIDLSQAEAVWEMLEARTRTQVQMAAGLLTGELSRLVCEVKSELTDVLALLAGSVDFPDEIDESGPDDIFARLETGVAIPLQRLVSLSEKTEIVRRGPNVVLVGRPNVGKSSLLNRLLGRDRAIVSTIAGTTRDSISESTLIAGKHATLWDTAGIRTEAGALENLGMERTRRACEEADVVVLVAEAHRSADPEDIRILGGLCPDKTIVAANKSDLLSGPSPFRLTPPHDTLSVTLVSALTGIGMDELSGSVWRTCGVTEGPDLCAAAPNLRQRTSLSKALAVILDGVSCARKNFMPELLAFDLEQALFHIGAVTGETASPDILDSVFSRFCIGK